MLTALPSFFRRKDAPREALKKVISITKLLPQMTILIQVKALAWGRGVRGLTVLSSKF